MQPNFKEYIGAATGIDYFVGDADRVLNMENTRAMPPFSDKAVDFFNDLSKLLLKKGRAFSDVATFAFWCRKASLEAYKKKYDDIHARLGRGIIFHSTPSNVPVNFAFSFAAGLLAGNANIVRLPAKDFEQVGIICDAINELIADRHKEIAPYVVMLKYGMIQEASDCFSSICDTRVVWGGDNTVNGMRRSPIKPRATEIAFADRHSIAVINVDAYEKAEDKQAIADNFYNDTYFSDQNACTSPRLIVWYGANTDADKTARAKSEFWNILHDKAKEKNYELAPVQAVGKLTALYKAASAYSVKKEDDLGDNLIVRVRVDSIDKDLMKYKYNSGFFFEYDTDSLQDVMPCCNEPCQTLSYYGFDAEQLRKEIIAYAPRGIDRIVPIGKTMDFDPIWDGHDLIRELSRKIGIRE